MKEEQIKQNAEQYAEEHMVRTDGGGWEEEYDYEEQEAAYIAGAHSRDEEIEQLKKQIEHLSQREQMLFDREVELIAENDKLRNPWISVDERLPEKVNKFLSDEVLVRYLRGGKEYTFVTHYDYEYQTWNIPNVTHWMPIPE